MSAREMFNKKLIEEDEPIEKIEIERNSQNANYYIMNEFGTKCFLTKHSKMIAEKINEVIDMLNELKKESDK